MNLVNSNFKEIQNLSSYPILFKIRNNFSCSKTLLVRGAHESFVIFSRWPSFNISIITVIKQGNENKLLVEK